MSAVDRRGHHVYGPQMPCLIGCLALAFPRVALALVWLFGGDYVSSAFPHWIWPLLGFFCLPVTTLAFVYSSHSLSAQGHFTPLGWVVVGIAGLIDLGVLGGGGSSAARRRRARERERDRDRLA